MPAVSPLKLDISELKSCENKYRVDFNEVRGQRTTVATGHGSNESYCTLFFDGTEHGWMIPCYDGGPLKESTDGGLRWKNISDAPFSTIVSTYFSAGRRWILVRPSSNGMKEGVFVTDSGTMWQPISNTELIDDMRRGILKVLPSKWSHGRLYQLYSKSLSQ